MRRALGLAVVALAVMLVPAASATAKKGRAHALAAKTCSVERKVAGRDGFLAKYGSPAMPGCKGFVVKLARDAGQDCKQERRELGRADFNDKYGTNRNKRNAMGKCVSAKVKAAVAEVCPEDLDDEDADDDEVGDDDADDLGDDLGEADRLARAHGRAPHFASCVDEDGDDVGDDVDDEDRDDVGDDDAGEVDDD
jgi:hypothetical protein